jgi:hypothetical protein
MKIELTWNQKAAIMTEVRLDVQEGLIKDAPMNIDRRYKACTEHVVGCMQALNVYKYAAVMAAENRISINFSTLTAKGINVDELIKVADANRDNVSHYTAGLNNFTMGAGDAQEIAFREALKDMLSNI